MESPLRTSGADEPAAERASDAVALWAGDRIRKGWIGPAAGIFDVKAAVGGANAARASEPCGRSRCVLVRR
jgi:hypothetical protein